MRHLYPLMLDVTDRLVVIVGGGGVAVRKAKGLLEAGARRVRAVAPLIDALMPEAVEHVNESYAVRYLEGAGLVFAATDSPAVNEAVVRDCRARGIWVNRADTDDHEPGDFTTPAKFDAGNVIVTVSAGGNPALAVLIRDAIAARFEPAWKRMADLMDRLRPRVLDAPLTIEQRRAIFRDCATPEALAVLETDGEVQLMNWLGKRHPQMRSLPEHGNP